MVRLYRPSDHARLAEMYASHGKNVPFPASLSDLGVINNCAAGFLYTTNSDVAYLEGYVTDSVAPLRDRRDSLEEVTGTLVDVARNMDCRHVFTTCTARGIARLAFRHGFKSLGSALLMAKEL